MIYAKRIDERARAWYTVGMNEELTIYEKNYIDHASGRLIDPVETPGYRIVQLGDSFYRRRLAMPPHPQYCDLELTVAVERTAEVYADETALPLSSGEVYLSFRGEKHRIAAERGLRYQYVALNFREGAAAERLKGELLSRHGKKDARAVRCPAALNLTAEILAESMRESPDPLRFDCLISELLFSVLRADEPQRRIPASPEEVAPAVANYIDQNFASVGNLSALAERYGYTYGHLSEIFRRAYGMGPKKYLTRKRTEYAQNLLKGGLSVTEAAEKAGYSSVYHFSRAFKTATGKAPSLTREGAED